MRRRIVALVGCMAVLLAVALPASAARTPTTGERIDLYTPPTSFTADSPFYIEHGFACAHHDHGCFSSEIARGDFQLYVDGVLQPSRTVVEVSGGSVYKWRLTNFPSGLPAGTYTIEGVWTVDGAVTQTKTATIDFS